MQAEAESRAYLDYAATAPFDERLVEVLTNASWANANSLHTEGKEAAAQLRDARARIAKALGAHAPSEIIFTSGGTEADNMGVICLSNANKTSTRKHIIVSAIEHHAVLDAARAQKQNGFIIDILHPDAQGIITPESLLKAIEAIEQTGDEVSLVAVHLVNNEIGTIQPICELAQISHDHGAFFFMDAVQALGKVEIDLDTSGVDAAAFSAHKIGAPKGIGVLYVRRGLRIAPIIFGGGQEAGLRSGTSNVPSACAFAAAIVFAAQERDDAWNHAERLRRRLIEGMSTLIEEGSVSLTLEEPACCVPHILSFIAEGHEGETIVLKCDNAGIAISSGSACSSRSLEPSHVMTELGLNKDRALGALRVSFGRMTTEEDIDMLLSALPEVLA